MSPVRLNGSTSGYSELSAPAVAGSNTLVLPTGNGTNGQMLTTNGSGVLSWSSITLAELGVGQTWQNVTASRAFGTTYTNSTGKPIEVVIAFAYPGAGQSGVLTVGGVAIQFGQVNAAYIQVASGSAIVPPGATYVFSTNTTINQWLELR